MMGPREWEDRKPMVWAAFASAAIADVRNGNAADKADEMCREFECRFVVNEDDET